MKKIIFLIVALAFSLTVFAQQNKHQVRTEKGRKEQFHAPVIRIGALSGSFSESKRPQVQSVPDTQAIYVLTVEVDSVLVVDEATIAEQNIVVDSVAIDTFYQIGAAIVQNDYESTPSDEDWIIIRDEIFKDSSLNDIDIHNLTYDEYLELQQGWTAQIDQVTDTTMAEAGLIFQPIILQEEPVTTVIDTSVTKNILPAISVAKSENISDTNQISSSVELMDSRLFEMERKLDTLLSYQLQQNKVDQLKPVLPSTSVKTFEELTSLQKKIERLESNADRENNLELERLKKELSNYGSQKNEQLEKDENSENLKKEIASLRQQINDQQKISDTPSKEVVVVESTRAVTQLKAEVASLTQNMELMRQLLLQQQIIAGQKTQTISIESPKDTTNKELVAIKKELEDLKASMVSMNATKPVTENLVPVVDENKVVIDSLKYQLIAIQNELKKIQELKTPEPVIETKVEKVIVEKPIEPSLDIMSKIKGKEKQIVFFKIGSAMLSPESVSKTGSMAQLMLQYDSLFVRLEAYTDASGDAAKNLLLSKKRAEAVKSAIMQYGISENRIMLESHGEDIQSDPSFGRRVEIILSTLK